ncbi:SDR family NAD(P)-dependent oxidoreductase [Kitasatospora sp. SUK 42]|uniref:SDR family NAD(P)-dependent oxidoreductase n=1 Tax=Kitasatospora sp. SUK 42 TaxID=1588882 RepID=UPI0018C9E938|nr:SDR family NAD(P)-dependent oxidoreductase [Kitasatospora sp. SUK 42]MBV2155249.1 SDR family oxidoreductase [Kitasatospora sp. SUK 42]
MGLLDDKVTIVTGAGRGIGATAARLFAREGALLVLAARSGPEVAVLAEELCATGAEAVAVAADLTTAEGAGRAVDAALKAYGRLDAAFDNAGNGLVPAPLAERSEAEWDDTHALNLRGTWLCLRAQLRAMAASGRGGAVVLNSGVGALVGGFGDGAQQAAKHGLTGLVKAATADYARHGIRVNAVAPGVVRTPGSEPYFAAGPEFAALVARSTPLGRPGLDVEVAEAAAWLLSDRASYVAGVTLPVDGGITATRRFD